MKRTRPASSLFLTASVFLVAIQGCNTTTDLQPVPQGSDGGANSATGGNSTVTPGSSTGGSTSTATTTPGATGGTATAGGGTTSGNPQGGSPTGGKANTATGGHVTTPTGGTPGLPTGGTPGIVTGGTPGIVTGGTPGLPTGGTPITPATGGTSAGSTVVNTGTTVTFAASGKASGAMSGWAFVAMGLTDTVSVPTCGTPPAAITNAAQCNSTTNWPAAGICITGSVPTNPSPYTSWGINVGVNSTDPKGGGLGQAFTSVAIAATGAPAGATFRYIISVGTTDYCASATIGTAVAFSTFNTKCYDTPPDGVAYTGNGSDITGVQLQIVPGPTATITVTNLCLTGITFS